MPHCLHQAMARLENAAGKVHDCITMFHACIMAFNMWSPVSHCNTKILAPCTSDRCAAILGPELRAHLSEDIHNGMSGMRLSCAPSFPRLGMTTLQCVWSSVDLVGTEFRQLTDTFPAPLNLGSVRRSSIVSIWVRLLAGSHLSGG